MANVTYNGRGPSLGDRVRSILFERKADVLPVARPYQWEAARYVEASAANFIEQGYRLNSAVFVCVRALASSFAEAPLRVYSDETRKKALDNHPLQILINRPNEIMGQREWWKYIVTYGAIGGNGYGHILSSRGGKPAEMWPYHDAHMCPVPNGSTWVDHYEYSLDGGVHKIYLEPAEVFHFKKNIDPSMPWRGMSDLGPIWREVNIDNELVRYVKAVLQNDAVPRGIIQVPEGAMLTPTQRTDLRNEWRLKFGGSNRGDVAVLDKGMSYNRIALSMDELAVNALHGMNEARIAAAFNVQAIVAGLLTGLEHGREGNWESTRKQFYEGSMATLWADVASAVQQDLVPLFGNDCYVAFDTTEVEFFRDKRRKEATLYEGLWKSTLLSQNEARTRMGEEALKGDDLWYFAKGQDVLLLPDLHAYVEEQTIAAHQALAQADAALDAADMQNDAQAAALEQPQGDMAPQDAAQAATDAQSAPTTDGGGEDVGLINLL